MFFRGFRASLKLNRKKHYDAIEFESANPICGAYRMNSDEFYADTASEVTLNQSSFIFEPPPPLRPSKSTNNLTFDQPVTFRKKEISMNPKGGDFEQKNRQDREPRKAENDRTKTKSETKTSNNEKKKSKAPAPPPMQIETLQSNNFTEKVPINRIDSSLERSLKTTGPPPYDLVSDKLEVIPNRRDLGIVEKAKLNNQESSLNKLKSNINKPEARVRKLNKSFLDLNYNEEENIIVQSENKEELV